MKSMRFDGIYNEKEAEVGHGGVCPYIYIYVLPPPPSKAHGIPYFRIMVRSIGICFLISSCHKAKVSVPCHSLMKVRIAAFGFSL